MAIITFKSKELKETGQTLSLAAIATNMAIEHSYKILIVSTNFQDQTLENCFWELDKLNAPIITGQGPARVGVDSGIEGLIKILASNKTSTEIVKNYSRTILRDRLDMLLSPNTNNYDEYLQTASHYPEILQIANRYYDLIFVDLTNKMREKEAQDILDISDVIILSTTQRLKSIDDIIELRQKDEFYKRNNVMLLVGRYDSFSKYNIKNISRYMHEKKLISAVPYNTLFFESCSEGKIIDFFLKLRNIDANDRNYTFVTEVSKMNESIIYKLQELQMKI